MDATRRGLLGAAATLCSGLAGCGAPDGNATTIGAGSGATTAGGRAPMVRVEGGTYTIGSDSGPAHARPAHEVALSAFHIDR
ncbi:MAG: hypothetical protein ABEH77_09215 [Halobacteriaceae archaeon]